MAELGGMFSLPTVEAGSEGDMVTAGMRGNEAWELRVTQRRGSIWSSVMVCAGFEIGALKCTTWRPSGPTPVVTAGGIVLGRDECM